MPSYQELLRDYSDRLLESQYWHPDTMRAFQERQLEWVLTHARANSPFYATRLDAIFRPDGSIDFSRWGEIPLLTRNDLAEHHDAMLARNVPPNHGASRDYTTSGSSGVPITVTATGLAALGGQAAEYRAFDWHGIDYSKTLCHLANEPLAVAPWPDGRRRGPWGPAWINGSSAGRRVEVSIFETYPHILDFLKRAEVEYLITGPTVAYALALEAQRLGFAISLDTIMLYGSAPTIPGMEACHAAFGSKFLPRYSSKELNGIAHQCAGGTNYHVHAENMFVELLDDNNEPCVPGKPGRVVVTPFFNTHQPLIRYDLGDIATFGPPCSCGRTLPVLEEIIGRVSHVFRFPDGTNIYRRLPQALRVTLKAGMWQVAQVAPLEIELRYEPLDWNEVGDEASVIEFMRTIYPADVAIRAKRVEHVPLTPAGKLIEYSYEVAS